MNFNVYSDKPSEPEKPLTKEEKIKGLLEYVKDFKAGTIHPPMKLVIILDEVNSGEVTLEEIGLSKDDFQNVQKTLERSHVKIRLEEMVRLLYLENRKSFLTRSKKVIREKVEEIDRLMKENNITFEELKASPEMINLIAKYTTAQ